MAKKLFKGLLDSISSPEEYQGNVYRAKDGDLKKKMDDIYQNGQALGTSCHINNLHENFRWRDGFLYAFSGYPGAGKSTFLSYLMMLRAKREGLKIALYSPESYPIEDLTEELCRMYIGGNISPTFGGQVIREDYEKALQFVHDHFYFLDFGEDIPSIQNLYHEFDYLIRTEGIGTVIIDPFNAVAEGADASSYGGLSAYLKAALTKSKLFAVKNEIPVILVEHPRSTGTLKAGESRPDPSPFMIYGGSMWHNKCDVFVTVDRDMIEDVRSPIVDVRIWKVKKQRQMGIPGEVSLYYDVKTSSYN